MFRAAPHIRLLEASDALRSIRSLLGFSWASVPAATALAAPSPSFSTDKSYSGFASTPATNQAECNCQPALTHGQPQTASPAHTRQLQTSALSSAEASRSAVPVPQPLSDSLLSALSTAVGRSKVSTNPSVLEAHGKDESYRDSVPPQAVVQPESTEQVAQVRRFACAHVWQVTAWQLDAPQ